MVNIYDTNRVYYTNTLI